MNVPLNAPSLGDLEKQYVLDALESGWTTTGQYVTRFEFGFSAFCHRQHAVAVSSGTAALTLAIMALRLSTNQRILTQSYTCDAVANASYFALRKPPLVGDVDFGTWSLRAADVETALAKRPEIGAVVLAHTYGVPGKDTEAIEALCKARGIPLIEDASEAHGAMIGPRPTGSFGDISVLSLRGEKTLGAGQFGVALTDNPLLAQRIHQLAHNGLPADTVRYWSTAYGMNFQPSNLTAALACAQLDRVHELVRQRNAIHQRWRDLFAGVDGIEFQAAHGRPAWWLTGFIYYPEFTTLTPGDLGSALKERGVETRPGFYPIHALPHVGPAAKITACDVSDLLLRQLILLPSGPTVTEAQQDYVYRQLLDVIGRG